MINLIADVSRYLMILLAGAYTWMNFRYFLVRDERKKKRICGFQIWCMFLLHLLAYAVMWLKTGNEGLIAFYALQVAFFLGYIFLYRLCYRNCSRLLINNMCMLFCIGLIMLARLSPAQALKQFVMVAAAGVLTWIIPFIMDRVWQLAAIPWVYGLLGLVLLSLVWGLGITSYGARISLGFQGFYFQPSEFVKISFVFFVAAMFYRSTSPLSVILTTVMAALHVLVLTASKDLGSALIFFVTYVLMAFAATGRWWYLLGGAGFGILFSTLAYRLFSHVRVRVKAWLNPWSDMGNTGYQITQSLFAIGTGGWLGMGLYQGMPGKIPVVENDFIFSAISEELGGIFALCLVLICFGCYLQFMMIAGRMQAVFYKLIAFGLGTVYIVQVFLTVGGATKFIPSTGVTLPFVSYGGSSIFSTFILFGVMQGMYLLKQNEEEEQYEKG